MSDENFNEHLVRRNISNFIERRYSRNGRGGLFTVRHCIKDMRNVEIWYQMCWYLDEVIKEEGVND